MTINVTEAKLKHKELSYFGTFPLLDDLLDHPGAVFCKPAEVTGNYVYIKDEIFFDGLIELHFTCPCDRCLKRTEVQLQIDFKESFVKDSIDYEIYGYSGDLLDLTKAVSDTVTLSVPNKVLCKKSCKGLCPTCGKNLNEVKCDCGEEIDPSNKFYELLKLKK